MSYCYIFIGDSSLMRLVLQRFFSTLVGVLTSDTLGGTTKYVLIGFTVLLLITSYSNTEASPESDK